MHYFGLFEIATGIYECFQRFHTSNIVACMLSVGYGFYKPSSVLTPQIIFIIILLLFCPR